MFAVDHHPHPPSYCTAVNLSRWYARLIKLLGEHQAGNIAQAEAEARERKKLTPAGLVPVAVVTIVPDTRVKASKKPRIAVFIGNSPRFELRSHLTTEFLQEKDNFPSFTPSRWRFGLPVRLGIGVTCMNPVWGSCAVCRPSGDDVQSREKNTDLWKENYQCGPGLTPQGFDPPLPSQSCASRQCVRG